MKWLFIAGCLAAAAALGLEVWKHTQQAKETKRYAHLKLEAEQLMDGLFVRLRNPEDCTALLGGQNATPASRLDIELNYQPDPEGDVQLVSAKLDTGAEDDFRTEIANADGVAVELRRYMSRIRATFFNREGVGVEIARRDPIFIWTTPPPPVGNAEIQSCFGPSSAGALCNDLGGYFIPGFEPYDESCRLSMKTLRRNGGALNPVANCRVAGIANSPAKCPRYGLQFGAVQLNEVAKVVPVPGNKFLCQLCL